MATTTPEQLSRIAYSVYTAVLNKRDPIAIDRKARPWLAFMLKHSQVVPMSGGSAIVKLKHDDGLDMQGWTRLDPLGFGEATIEIELKFDFFNIHRGLQFVHDDLFQLGYTVVPNGPRGSKTFARKMSEDDALRLVDYVEEVIETFMDGWDRQFDIMLHRDGTYDTKVLPGLDSIVPIANTAGTVGYQARTNPLVQHYVKTGMTTGAAGNLRTELTKARRQANLNNAGSGQGQVDFIMAGSTAIDAYISFATVNGWVVNTNATGTPKLDIGIPETGIEFEGLPIVYNPTMDLLDTIETGLAQPWAKRMYLLNSKVWLLGHPEKLDKYLSSPTDPGDQRKTRFSMDGRYAFICKVPNANALCTVA